MMGLFEIWLWWWGFFDNEDEPTEVESTNEVQDEPDPTWID
jgi:hypothetical protein